MIKLSSSFPWSAPLSVVVLIIHRRRPHHQASLSCFAVADLYFLSSQNRSQPCLRQMDKDIQQHPHKQPHKQQQQQQQRRWHHHSSILSPAPISASATADTRRRHCCNCRISTALPVSCRISRGSAWIRRRHRRLRPSLESRIYDRQHPRHPRLVSGSATERCRVRS